jgi:hypothetical protein
MGINLTPKHNFEELLHVGCSHFVRICGRIRLSAR